MNSQHVLKNTKQINYHGIKNDRLLSILEYVKANNAIPSSVTSREKTILMGTLIEHWFDCAYLTELGSAFHRDLQARAKDPGMRLLEVT